MRRSFSAVVMGVMLSAGVCAHAQAPKPSTTLQLPAAPLLPDEFGGWKVADAANAPALPADLSDSVKKEFIVKREMTHAYQSGDAVMQIRAEQFVDGTGAYAAFTALRQAGMKATAEKIGEESVANSETVLFWNGPTVVEVSAKRADLKALQALSSGLPKVSGAAAQAPGLIKYFPKTGFRKETVQYAVGPDSYTAQKGQFPISALDFSKAPEIATAEYGNGGILTLISYPTNAIAGDRSRALLSELTAHPPEGTAVDSILVKRAGPIVAITTGKFTQAQAKKLLDDVHYGANITWNKTEGYISEASKAAKLVVGIILGVFAIAIAAFVIGIFLGGGRALFRVMRGKPASSMHDTDFIHLELTGHPKRGADEPISVQSER